MEKLEIPKIDVGDVRTTYYSLHQFWRRIIPLGGILTDRERREINKLSKEISGYHETEDKLKILIIVNKTRYVVQNGRHIKRPEPIKDPKTAVIRSQLLRSALTRHRIP